MKHLFGFAITVENFDGEVSTFPCSFEGATEAGKLAAHLFATNNAAVSGVCVPPEFKGAYLAAFDSAVVPELEKEGFEFGEGYDDEEENDDEEDEAFEEEEEEN